MMRRVYSIALVSVFCVAAGKATELPPKGELRLEAKAIHPYWRTDAFPHNTESDVNPVSFLWPSQRREYKQALQSYDFECADDAEFTTIVEQSYGQNPSFYVAKKPLADGKWYWRYRETGKNWQGPFVFTVGESSRLEDQRPTAQEFVNAVRGERPRFVYRRDTLDSMRKDLEQSGDLQKILSRAEQSFNTVLPKEKNGGYFTKNGEWVFLNKKFPPMHHKGHPTGKVYKESISNLCLAYVFTGQKKYADEAIRWGMQVTNYEVDREDGKDPNNENPYPDGFDPAHYMRSLAMIYDVAQQVMTEDQRKTILGCMAEYMDMYYRYFCNRLENRCIDNHAWQISVRCLLNAALTAKGDLPEADSYLAYLHDVWTAKDPEQGRNDGGFHAGSYTSVNVQTWREVAILFRKFTGYNYYDRPFFRNQPTFWLYRQAPGSKGDGFNGDGYGTDKRGPAPAMVAWFDMLDADLDLPVANYISPTVPDKQKHKYRMAAWVRKAEGLAMESAVKNKPLPYLPQAKAFHDVGVVNMHRDMLNPKMNLLVSLRSSPYGTVGHNLASHNAFNVVYQSEQLFMPYGTRQGGDKNHAACYRNTRGHNSVLINGKGQPFSPEAYGWIARFLHGDKISYACGDASNAYDAGGFYKETFRFKNAGLNIDDYVSRGDIKRFRRHVLFLRPATIVIYDELEANKDVQWDWILHCRKNMTANGTELLVDGVDASATIRSSSPLEITIHDKPLFPALNLDGRGGVKPGTPYPVKGCHAIASSKQKTDKLRILTLIQVGQQKAVKEKPGGTLQCGEWIINPVMDADKLANLKISNTDNSAQFLLKSAEKGESVLTEKIDGKRTTRRVVDELPYMARGLKQLSNIK